MQEYDESFFRAKANKRARLTWLILLVIITVYYGVKIPSGDVELSTHDPGGAAERNQ